MKKAFTLVEMLVAVVLLSLLIGVALFSMRLQLITISKVKLHGINQVLKYNQLKTPVESMKYYAVQEYDMLNRPIKYKWHYFFKGDSHKMSFITQNPLFSNADSLVELKCVDDRLLYTEEPLYQRIDFLRPRFLKDSTTYIIYDDIQKCQFSYKTRKGKEIKSLIDDIPSYVMVKLDQEEYFIKVQNDYNKTISEIFSRIYDE